MSKKFKHLNLSPHWQQYFSKYPQGYTIIENLIDWVSQVDDMVDNQNELNETVETYGDRLDEFIGQYDTHLQETLEQTLSDWQDSGFLDVVIDEALETKYHEMDERLTTQLEQTPSGVVNPVSMFGAKGDGVADDTQALKNAFQVAVDEKRPVDIPPGIYNISEPLPIKTGLTVRGSAFRNTIIRAIAPFKSIFITDELVQVESVNIQDIYFDGNNLTDHGVLGNKLSHTTIFKNRFSNILKSAIEFGNGWCNDIIQNVIRNNGGDGIVVKDEANNIVNINKNKIFLNGGLGVYVANGRNVNITENTIETNAKGGILHAYNVQNLNIDKNYFEANGHDGYDLFGVNYSADVIVNGSPASIGYGFPARQLFIGQNTHQPTANNEAHYILLAVNKGSIVNNSTNKPELPLVKSFVSSSQTNISDLDIKNNDAKEIVLDGFGETKRMNVNTWSIDDVIKSNLIDDDFENWAIVNGVATSTLSNTELSYQGQKVGKIEMVAQGHSHHFGRTINITENPEFANKLFYFSVWVKQSREGMGASIRLTGSGRSHPISSNNTGWRKITHVGKLPESGNASFDVQLYNGQIGDELLLSMPVVSVVGNKDVKMW